MKTKPSGRKARTSTKLKKFRRWRSAPDSAATDSGSTANGPSLRICSWRNSAAGRWIQMLSGWEGARKELPSANTPKRNSPAKAADKSESSRSVPLGQFEIDQPLRSAERAARQGLPAGCEKSKGFDAPDEPGHPGFLCAERRAPDGQNLRTLINALETFLGFRDRFDRRNPELLDERRVQRDADALPAVFHAQDGTGQRTTEAKMVAARRRLKEAVGFGGRKKIDDRFDAHGQRLLESSLDVQSDLASRLEAARGRTERKLLNKQEFGAGRLILALQRQEIRTEKLGFVRRRAFHGEGCAGESDGFAQLQSFIISMRARGVKDHDAEGVARPAIVTKKAVQAGFFHAGLFVNGGDRAGGGLSRRFAQTRVIGLGTAPDGIDERGGGRAEIKGGNGATVTGLYKGLRFERSKEQLVCAVGIVVQQLHTRDEGTGSLPVGNGLGANQIAPGIGAQMRGIDSAKNTVPIGVIALGAHEQIARLQQFIGRLSVVVPRRRGGDARGNAQHFLVQQIGFRVFAKKAAPGTSTKERQDFWSRAELL